MMSADESGTKTTQFVRSLLAVCFFCMGMWLAKDSGANFLRGDIEETAKDATLVGNIKGEETTPVPAPQRSGGAPKPKNQDKGAIEGGDKRGIDEGKDLPFRFCNGMEKVHIPTDEKNGFHLRYRCIGPEYDAFADHLHAFVEKDRPNHHPLWGKRGIPANQTFLILGSSHLQQVAQSLVCQEDQYGSGLVGHEYLDPDVHPLVMVRYTFGNGAVVYHGANDWTIHMRQWPMYLANQTGYPLDKFDRVIVGTTNSCNPPVHTNFADDMKQLLASRFGVDCENPEGPPFKEYAKIFRQPLMYVNMFALYSHARQVEDRREFLATRHHYKPLYYEDARKYIDKMGKGVWECGALSMKQRLDCVNNETATMKLHRCQGERGAHPDLIAWDLVEFMNGDYSGMEPANTKGGTLRHWL